MGSKTRARELMQDAGVPIVPGTTAPVPTLAAAAAAAEEIGYPVALKAAGIVRRGRSERPGLAVDGRRRRLDCRSRLPPIGGHRCR